MEYAKIDGISPKLSRLVYGTPQAALGEFSEATCECYDAAWEAGFRVFDTAHSYGNAEENFGKWISRRSFRSEMVILDKGCNPGAGGSPDVFSAQTIREQLTMSLERLQTDYVDLYILHRDDETRPIEEIVDVLNEFKESGKVGRFGGSNFRKYRLEAANAYAAANGLTGFTVCSPNYCLAHLANDPWGGSVTVSGDENLGYREWLIRNQMPVFNYSAVGRGFLSGKYRTDSGIPIEQCLPMAPIWEYYVPENVARLQRAEKMAAEKGATVSQIALAWLLCQKLNLFPIVCPTGEAHLRDNIEALNIKLTSQEMDWLEKGE